MMLNISAFYKKLLYAINNTLYKVIEMTFRINFAEMQHFEN